MPNLLFILLALVLGLLPLGSAYAAPSEEEKIAAELANPLSPITTVAMQYRAEFGNGPENDLNHQLRLQPSLFKPFHDTSAFLLRTALPVRAIQFPSNEFGLGDLSLTPYFVPDTTHSTFIGYGGTLSFPTATENTLGSKKWSAGPAIMVAQVGDPIVYGGLMQQLWSYAGASDRKDVSVATIQPFITYLLGGGLSATVNSESSYDFEGATGSRWVIPLTAGVSKVIAVQERYINVGLAVASYLERPDSGTDYEIRLNFTYVMK